MNSRLHAQEPPHTFQIALFQVHKQNVNIIAFQGLGILAYSGFRTYFFWNLWIYLDGW